MFELKPDAPWWQTDDVIKLDFGVIPSGYIWLFPYGDRLSVGAMTSKGSLPDAKGRVLKYVAEDGALAGLIPRFLGGRVVPFWTHERGAGRGCCVLAGDAAGFVDAFIGEGLSWAIRSGQLAAAAIIATRGASESYASLHSEYISQLKREVLPELRRAYWFGRAAYKYPNFVFKCVSRLARNADLFAEIARSKLSYRSLLWKILGQLVRRK